MAKDSLLDYSTTPDNNTDIGGIGIQGTSSVKNFDNAFRTLMSQMRQDIDYRRVYTVKSTNYTAVLNDNNASIVFSAAATLSLTAAATLGTNWHVRVYAKGGKVTIDPNGSETIDGFATVIIGWGGIVDVFCDGSNFVTMRVDTGMEAIGPQYDLTGVAQADWTGLSDFAYLRLVVEGTPAAQATDVGFRVSTNNGASYLSGASDYQGFIGSDENTSRTITTQFFSSLAPIIVSTSPINPFPFLSVIEIAAFNKASTLNAQASTSYFAAPNGLSRRSLANLWGGTVARNALRFISSVSFTRGQAQLFGIRG